MATELRILSWCDACLAADKQTPGRTLTVDVSPIEDVAPYDVELCAEHAGPLVDAVTALAAYGRPVGTGVPKTPAGPSTGKRSRRRDDEPNPTACPECGNVYKTTAVLRGHLRHEHGKSLADVGLEAATHTCPVCGGKFGNGQGLAAHVRLIHKPPARRRKESA